ERLALRAATLVPRRRESVLEAANVRRLRGEKAVLPIFALRAVPESFHVEVVDLSQTAGGVVALPLSDGDGTTDDRQRRSVRRGERAQRGNRRRSGGVRGKWRVLADRDVTVRVEAAHRTVGDTCHHGELCVDAPVLVEADERALVAAVLHDVHGPRV